MSSFKTPAGVNRGLKGGLKNLVPVQELSSPSSISERKDTVVNVMVAVAGKDGDVDKIKEAVFNSHEFTDLRQALVHKTIEQQRALKTPKKTDENEEGKESNKPKRIHQSTGKIMISPDNARGALFKEKDDDLGNYVLEVCECSTHVGKEKPVHSLVHPASLLDQKTRLQLFGDVDGQHTRWHYKGSIEEFIAEYSDAMKKAGKIPYERSSVYAKVKGVIVEEKYRDGVCEKCREGHKLEEKKKLEGGNLRNEHDQTNYNLYWQSQAQNPLAPWQISHSTPSSFAFASQQLPNLFQPPYPHPSPQAQNPFSSQQRNAVTHPNSIGQEDWRCARYEEHINSSKGKQRKKLCDD